MSPSHPVSSVSFGPFRFDPASRELFRDGQRVAVPQKPLQVLAALVRQPGVLVTREELRRALWAQDTFVDFDSNLNVAVRKLRECLGDDAERPVYVETLPRRGYRFIAVVRGADDPGAAESPRRPQRVALTLATLVLIAGAWIGFSWRLVRERPLIAVHAFEDVSGSDQRPLASGLTADLLAQFGRAGSGQYRVIDVSHSTVASMPRPDYAVHGSTYRDAQGLHVTARLVDGERGQLIWAGTFACPKGDTASIRQQLALKITSAVNGTLRSD